MCLCLFGGISSISLCLCHECLSIGPSEDDCPPQTRGFSTSMVVPGRVASSGVTDFTLVHGRGASSHVISAPKPGDTLSERDRGEA